MAKTAEARQRQQDEFLAGEWLMSLLPEEVTILRQYDHGGGVVQFHRNGQFYMVIIGQVVQVLPHLISDEHLVKAAVNLGMLQDLDPSRQPDPESTAVFDEVRRRGLRAEVRRQSK